MKIKRYKNITEAIESIIKKDKEYVLIKHSLGVGREIKTHFHRKANEFIVIDSGKFEIRIEKEIRVFNLKKKATTIFFPKNKKHSLLTISSISYFVIRDERDVSVYKK